MRLHLETLLGRCIAIGNRSTLLFVFLFSAMNIAASAVGDYGLRYLGINQGDGPEFLSHGVVGLFLIAVVFGPAIETLFLQQLPILAARRFGAPAYLQFALGGIPFALLHFSAGAGGVAAGVAGGFFLSLAYLTFIPQSKMKAFGMTVAIHALHNMVPFVICIQDLP